MAKNYPKQAENNKNSSNLLNLGGYIPSIPRSTPLVSDDYIFHNNAD